MYLRHSKQESEILGLKVGRGVEFLGTFDAGLLQQEILSAKYDICRLKISMNEFRLMNALESLKMPYSLFTVNYRNKKEYTANDSCEAEDGVSFQAFEPGDKNRLKHVVEGILNETTWPEYDTLFKNALLPHEKTRNLALSYFTSHNRFVDEDSRTWFLKYKNSDVGILIGRINGDSFEGVLGGIIPAFRGRKLSRLIYQAIDEFCITTNKKAFYNDIHVLNFPSQQSALRGGLRPTNVYTNIIIYSMCSMGSPVEQFQLAGTDLDQLLLEIPTRLAIENPTLQLTDYKSKVISKSASAKGYDVEVVRTIELQDLSCYNFRITTGEDIAAYGYVQFDRTC